MMRILSAEKDDALQTLISTRLTMRGYEVCEAFFSEEVIRYLERDRFDLLLLSHQMENIGGKRLIEKIRHDLGLMNVPIILTTSEHEISELLLSQERGFDDFLVKPFSPFVLQLRVALSIARTRQRIEANALTHLPGNPSIERVIREKIERQEKFSVLYVDINHFKSFNDRYGFEKGDDVIRQTAKILQQVRTRSFAGQECFVGHIGGDDFVVVLHPDHEETYARTFIAEFDRIIPTYYQEADRKRGNIRVVNRQGKRQTFPIMSCSVAGCTNLYREYKNLGEVAQDAAEVKSFLKSQSGSHYLRDRRSMPMAKLEEAMQVLAPEVKKEDKRKKTQREVDPLGQLLLNAGMITEEQLTLALKRHLETGQRLGQVFIEMNVLRSEQIGRMLEKKLNVPYVSLKNHTIGRDTLRYFTQDFIRAHRVVPLQVSGDQINLGMCDPFDLRTIDAIERITNLKPVPCLVLEDEFEDFLDANFDLKNWQENVG